MDVFFGLASAVSFGLLDIVITYVVQRVHALHILIVAHGLAALGLLFFLLLPTPFHITGTAPITLFLLLCIGVGIGLVSMLTNLSLYKALELGPLALVSPVTASYGLVTMTLAAIAFQNVPSLPVLFLLGLALLGMGLVMVKQDTSVLLSKHLNVIVPVLIALGFSLFVALCLCVSLQSFLLAPWLVLFCCLCEGACVFVCCCLALAGFIRTPKNRAFLPQSGLFFAVGALFGFGIEYFLLSLASQHLGPVQPVMASRLFSCLFFLACSGKARVGRWNTITCGQGTLIGLIGLIGLFDLAGTLCYTMGARENTFLVAALSSTYPLLPFLVGIYLGRERVSRRQWVGIISMIIGMVGISFIGK